MVKMNLRALLPHFLDTTISHSCQSHQPILFYIKAQLSVHIFRCVWWECGGTTSFLTRPRWSGRELNTSRLAHLSLGPHVKGQIREMTAWGAIGVETPTGAPGDQGSSPESGWKQFGTAPLFRGTSLTGWCCGWPALSWE